MVSAARGRPLIEMGSRRTHEQAAVAAARAAYIAGFDGSSNLEAQRCYGIPAEGTSAHAFTMLHARADSPTESTELAAFRAQVDALGVDTTLLVDTYDVTTGVANAVAAAGTGLGAVRIDSGELGVLARQVRRQLDELGATRTRIVVSGDLDEFSIAALAAEPVDSYGVGTSLVTGSGAPTANMVYKLVEVDGMPVQKRSSHKESHGGHKEALRLSRGSGTITEEVVYPAGQQPAVSEPARVLTVPLVRGGELVSKPNLAAARELVASGLRSLPWEGLNLSHGDPAVTTTQIPNQRRG
jgi:nicotinate phosphoribosyltransferase